MDPDQALADIRELIEVLEPILDDSSTKLLDTGDVGEELSELVEKFKALDGWLKGGGFLPKDWKKHG